MVILLRVVIVLFLLCNGVFVVLLIFYDVVWNKVGVNGLVDFMFLGGGDVGLNMWYENGKFIE